MVAENSADLRRRKPKTDGESLVGSRKHRPPNNLPLCQSSKMPRRFKGPPILSCPMSGRILSVPNKCRDWFKALIRPCRDWGLHRNRLGNGNTREERRSPGSLRSEPHSVGGDLCCRFPFDGWQVDSLASRFCNWEGRWRDEFCV